MTEVNFIALAKKRYAELQALNKIDNFYDYEKEFEFLLRDLGREVLEANTKTVPADRRKKIPPLSKQFGLHVTGLSTAAMQLWNAYPVFLWTKR